MLLCAVSATQLRFAHVSPEDNYFFVKMQTSAFSECKPTMYRSFLSAVSLLSRVEFGCRLLRVSAVLYSEKAEEDLFCRPLFCRDELSVHVFKELKV